MTRWKLWAIKRLLWRADAIICSLPTPDAPSGAYFDVWGSALSTVPSASCPRISRQRTTTSHGRIDDDRQG